MNILNYNSENPFFKTDLTLANKIKKDLDEIGYVIIKNFNINTSNIEGCRSRFIELSKFIGKPIGHDINNKIVWDIKSNTSSENFIKTYSEHSHEAELHTDSQYSEYPEDYFGLLTLRKATCGGGLSYIITLDSILYELSLLSSGVEIKRILSETKYPFIVPNVFKKVNTKEPEFNFGPILRENEIRFRIDTFEKAIEYDSNLCTEEQLHAYKEFKKIVLNSLLVKEFYLEEKDLIFINNKTTLHGRSSFTDKNRHLLRIRMNKFSLA